ncbi:MAG: hypothetical protein ABSB87_13755 [Terriglobales bacterium]|jgi:hypothetical protein
MSVAHAIFTMSKPDQEEAIRLLAVKSATRKEFERKTRPLLHAHYSGGATREQSKQLRHEWRQIYQSVKGAK